MEKDETKKIDELMKLLNLFLETNASDVELEKRTGISSSTVGRRLTDKKLYMKAYPNGEELYNLVMKKRQDNQLNGKYAGMDAAKITAYRKLRQRTIKNKGIDLSVIYPDKQKQDLLLVHMLLTYRVQFQNACKLFHRSSEELNQILKQFHYSFGTIADASLDYLLYEDNTNQELAINNLVDFYIEMLDALKNRDALTLNELLKEVTDGKVKDFIKNRNEDDSLSDDDILLMLNYQLKYSLNQRVTAEFFGITPKSYSYRLYKLLSTHPEIEEQYRNLAGYYSDLKQQYYRNNKQGR